MATDRRHPERGGEVAEPAGTAKPLYFNARKQPGELPNWMMAGVKIVVRGWIIFAKENQQHETRASFLTQSGAENWLTSERNMPTKDKKSEGNEQRDQGAPGVPLVKAQWRTRTERVGNNKETCDSN
jgi:hypothetical protein